MRRIHLFEFEDEPWLPHSLRVLVTQALQFMNDQIAVYDTVGPLLLAAMARSGASHIVDLCSGAGGPWSRLHRSVLAHVPDARVTLTDIYPQPSALTAWDEASQRRISYHPTPVDATRVPRTLTGVRTMFTSFHHFEPAKAIAILADAVAHRAPIAVFEFTRRRIGNVLLAAIAGGIGLPFVVPWLRPFRLSHVLWTFPLPIAPLVYAWDGAVSNLRTYSPADLEEMTEAADSQAIYEWNIGELTVPRAPAPITYLVGYPSC